MEPIQITYRNWRGLTRERLVLPLDRYWGVTAYHRTPGWMMRAWDLEKSCWRVFAESGILLEEEAQGNESLKSRQTTPGALAEVTADEHRISPCSNLL
jgi:predicted DNA-binding transcriptional regulator YafY